MINFCRFVQDFFEETLRVYLRPGFTSRNPTLNRSENLVLPECIESGKIAAESRLRNFIHPSQPDAQGSSVQKLGISCPLSRLFCREPEVDRSRNPKKRLAIGLRDEPGACRGQYLQ